MMERYVMCASIVLCLLGFKPPLPLHFEAKGGRVYMVDPVSYNCT
jgi:hypothetical protein